MSPGGGLLGYVGPDPTASGRAERAAARAPWRGAPVLAGATAGAAVWGLGGAKRRRDGDLCVVLHGRLDIEDEGGPAADPCALIASAYRRHGRDLGAHLSGDYALLVLEPGTGSILAVRDWVGARPLFWGRHGPMVALASEVKQVLALLGRPAVPNEETIAGYLADGPDIAPTATFVAGVEAVPACGDVLAGDERSQGRRRALRFPPVEASMDAAVHLVRARLDHAVARRSAGARRLGVLISGGMDSTSVAATAALRAARGAGPAVAMGFTIVVPEAPSCDESRYARAVAERSGIPWRGVTIPAPAALEWPQEGLRVHDGPVYPTFFLLEHLLRAAAQEGIDVLLVGQGADYWLGHDAFGMELAALRGDWRTAIAWARHDARRGGSRVAWRVGKLAVKRAIGKRAEEPFEVAASDWWLRASLEAEEREGLRHGVRVEFPFADYDLAATLSGLPARVRTSRDRRKHILRTAMDGILPPVVLSRTDLLDWRDVLAAATRIPLGQNPALHLESLYVARWREENREDNG